MAVAEREEAPAVNWPRPRSAPGKSAGIPYPLCSIPRHVSGDLDHITARMTHDRSHDGQPVHTFPALPLAASTYLLFLFLFMCYPLPLDDTPMYSHFNG